MESPQSSQRGARVTEDVGTALSRVLVAGQKVLADRVELAVHDGRQALHQAMVGVMLLALGGAALLCSLVAVDVALVEIFGQGSSRSHVLLGCGAVHGIIGAGLIYLGQRKRAAQ